MVNPTIMLHEKVLETILNEIEPIDIREVLKLPSDVKISEKYKIVAIVKNILNTAKTNHWQICIYHGQVYIYNGAFWDIVEKEDLKQFLGRCATNSGILLADAIHYEFKDKLMKQFFADAHFSVPKPDETKILINLLNGTFEFTPSGWKLRAFDPADFLTYQLPFEYDPQANCPIFNNFIDTVIPGKDSQTILQEFCGYIFTNYNLEKMLLLIGNGANGKSVFFNVLCALVGKKNLLNYSIGQFSHEYNRAKLDNILLNYSSERGSELDVDILKQLVSSEPLQARLPYGKPFTLNNKARFVINSNSLPKVTEQTEAYFRRWLIVPFDVTIPESERDTELANKIISSELPGVFNWLLVGLDRLTLNKKFTESPKSDFAVSEFRRKSDNVALFIEDKQIEVSTDKKVALADLYKSYKSFCSDDGYKALGKNNFSERFATKGFEKIRLNDGSAGFSISGEINV